MKIIIAPDSFKENLSALEVAHSIGTGFKRIIPEADYKLIPLADGGEGTLEILVAATSGTHIKTTVQGAYNTRIDALWGVLGDKKTAVIEAAQTIGLGMTEPQLRDLTIATSYGVGELIKTALDNGYRSFIIALGGSATNDGGSGLLSALGVRFIDADGAVLPPGGAALSKLAKIDLRQLDSRVKESSFKIACDVKNPLLGATGATHTYAIQKGATPEQLTELEEAMAHYAMLVNKHFQSNLSSSEGSGAAGGLAYGIAAFLNGSLLDGFELVAKTVQISESLQGANLVLTAEGQINWQTTAGKTPIGVATLAKKYGVPVIALTGQLGPGFEEVYKYGINAVFPISPGPISLQESIANAPALLSNTAENIARLWIARQKGF